MKKYETFLTILFIFSLILISPFSKASNTEQSDETKDTTSKGFDYYRDKILNTFNLTLDDYNALSPKDKEIVNKYILALWGYENGTLTSEEVEAMTKHNTPTPWWGILLYPLEGDFRSRTDEFFKFYFFSKAGVAVAERIKQIDVYLDSDGGLFSPFSESASTVMHLNLEEQYDFWNFGYVSGKSWIAPGPDDGIWGLDGVGLYAYCNPGYLDSSVRVVIKYQWQTWGLYDWEWKWIWQEPVYYHINTMNLPIIGPAIDIYDDDVYGPYYIPDTKETYIYDDNGNLIENPSFIYDDEDYLGIGLRAVDDSGINDVFLKVDGNQIPKSAYGWQRVDFLGIHQIWIYLLYPGIYGLGSHSVEITVEDNDNDRPNDRMTSDPITVDYYVYDDDITPPSINIQYLEGDKTDGNPGYWNVFAYDSQSGINGRLILVDGVQQPDNMDYYPYAVPNSLGLHTIQAFVYDNDYDRGSIDREQNQAENSVFIVDDDITPPIINYLYTGDGTDGNSGEIILNVWDASGLSVNPSGIYKVPNDVDIHEFSFIAIDNDNDRPNDQLIKILNIKIEIIDDDTTNPNIQVLYENGDGTDANPGYFKWNIKDFDDGVGGDGDIGLSEIEIKITYISSEGLDNYVNLFPGTENGSWNLPPYLGTYTITIFARDNDDDRTIIIDSLTEEITKPQDIIDDDTAPPELSDLIITHDIYNINVSLIAVDQSGISDFIIYVNGEEMIPLEQIQDGNKYQFILLNQWFFKNGIYEVEIQVTDADNDRPNDALTSSIIGTFEITLEDMYNYVDWQLEELKTYIDENLSCCLSHMLCRKLDNVQERLKEAYYLVESGKIACGLFYDVIAKACLGITEFKIEILNWVNKINDEDAEIITTSMHDIRNNIIILMGASVGTEQSCNIALIEVDLVNLNDFIEKEVSWNLWCLENNIKSAAFMLELAILKISLDQNVECVLIFAQYKLYKAECQVTNLLSSGKISQELADTIIFEINQAQESIEAIKNSF